MKWLLPPILWIFCLIAMLAIGYFVQTPAMLPAPWQLSGLAILIGGLAITIVAKRQFQRIDTNINTFLEPDTLVTEGLFAVSRNPMYLGFVASLAGVALLLNEAATLAPVAAFFVAAQFWYIPYEERLARQQFGDAYAAYRATVRRWI